MGRTQCGCHACCYFPIALQCLAGPLSSVSGLRRVGTIVCRRRRRRLYQKLLDAHPHRKEATQPLARQPVSQPASWFPRSNHRLHQAASLICLLSNPLLCAPHCNTGPHNKRSQFCDMVPYAINARAFSIALVHIVEGICF